MRAKLGWAPALAALLALPTAILALPATPAAAAEEQGAAGTALSDIKTQTTERSTRLTVESTRPVSYTYYSPDPLTVVVDIQDADAARLPSRINVGTREVESVRVSSIASPEGKALARLEVRLASLVAYQIYAENRHLNLVFDRSLEASRLAPAKPVEKPAEKPAEPAADASAKAAANPPAAPVVEAPAPAVETPRRAVAEAKPAAPPVEEAKPAARGQKASRILGVSQGSEKGQLAFTIRADGRLRYQDFFLGNPDRLVIDFQGVVSRSPVRVLEVNEGPVKKVRLAQFSAESPKVARLVLDLAMRAPYRIVEGSDGVKIVFGEGHTPSPAPLAALRSEPEPPAGGDGDAAAQAPPAAAPAPPPAADPVMPAPAPAPQTVVATETQAPASPAPVGPGTTTAPLGQKIYTGNPISLDFKEGDLQDIFRLFADISGLNVVVNPGVSGKVTLKLTEVPWDQALELILKTQGLGYTLEGNVIRIAKLADLQKEEADRRKLEEEKQLAGTLDVVNVRLSYAKAGDLEGTVKKVALSPRGNITLDPRTNTMIITDLPANIARAQALIADLDRPTPQVEIEARIVVTTRNFTRDLGIQWGFMNRQIPQFGNTTSLAFPNAIILNGSALVSGQGIPADPFQGLVSSGGIGPAISPTRGYAVNLPAAAANSGIGINLGNILGSFNIDAAITALERQGRGRLLSTPKVTTQNNLPAEIKQGVQIPIQTVANNTVTVSFKDAVLTLKVTPQITEARTVILLLEVENNSADFANLVNGIPPINTQSAKTTVLVKDGATAVIGGIFQSNEQTTLNQTPFFGRLPILGALFRNRFATTSNQELILFVTPRII
jgi:type IV pilus secretin PilQ/predicted competence protein